MNTPAKKGFFYKLTAPMRVQSLWKQILEYKIKDKDAEIAACTELLRLLSENSKSPDKRGVYTARANCYTALKQYDQAVEDHARAAEFCRHKKDWYEAQKSEDRMRWINNQKVFDSLDTSSPKAQLIWGLDYGYGYSDRATITEDKIHKLLAYLGDPDPDIRAKANSVVSRVPFHSDRRFTDWLISFYRRHMEGPGRYAGLRALRQLGRMMYLSPEDCVPLEVSLVKYSVTRAFTGATCAFCGWPNTGIPIPPKGLYLPFYSQKDDKGAYAVPAICDRCGNEFYLVWDQVPE